MDQASEVSKTRSSEHDYKRRQKVARNKFGKCRKVHIVPGIQIESVCVGTML